LAIRVLTFFYLVADRTSVPGSLCACFTQCSMACPFFKIEREVFLLWSGHIFLLRMAIPTFSPLPLATVLCPPKFQEITSHARLPVNPVAGLFNGRIPTPRFDVYVVLKDRSFSMMRKDSPRPLVTAGLGQSFCASFFHSRRCAWWTAFSGRAIGGSAECGHFSSHSNLLAIFAMAISILTESGDGENEWTVLCDSAPPYRFRVVDFPPTNLLVELGGDSSRRFLLIGKSQNSCLPSVCLS